MMTERKPLKQVVLSLTGQCNFACRYCYASEHSKTMLTPELACAAVALVAKQNGKQPFIVQFSGGEPLLNVPALKAVVELVEQQKLPCQLQIQTNGSLLTRALAQYLYEHKVGIGISLDGRPTVNDWLRLTKEGKGATSKTLQGLAILQELGIGCGLTCVVSAVNVKQLEGIIDFAYYLGNVRVLGFDLLRGQGRGDSLQPANKEQMETALAKVWQRNEALSKLTGYKIKLIQQEKASRRLREQAAIPFSHCHAMSGEAAFVDATGKFYACASFVGDERFYLGNVSTGIDTARVQAVAELVSNAMSFCRSCVSFDLCGGGCLARWYTTDLNCTNTYEAECTLKLFFAKNT